MLLFLLGSLLGPIRGLLTLPLLAVAVAVTVAHLCGWKVGLPSAKRIVPSEIIGRGHIVGALQFGFEMGTGARTFMPTFLPYITVVLVLTQSSAVQAALAGVGFGLGRAAMVAGRFFHGAPEQWDHELARLLRLLPWALLAVMAPLVWALLGRGL